MNYGKIDALFRVNLLFHFTFLVEYSKSWLIFLQYLSITFQLSWESEEFPPDWKLTNILSTVSHSMIFSRGARNKTLGCFTDLSVLLQCFEK